MFASSCGVSNSVPSTETETLPVTEGKDSNAKYAPVLVPSTETGVGNKIVAKKVVEPQSEISEKVSQDPQLMTIAKGSPAMEAIKAPDPVMVEVPPSLQAVNEIALLRSVPADILDKTRGGRPNAGGRVGGNIPEWVGAGNHRGAMVLLVVGIALKNAKDVEDAWRGVEETFQHQDAEGHLGADAGSDAFWMSWMNHGLVLLFSKANSQINTGPRFRL